LHGNALKESGLKTCDYNCYIMSTTTTTKRTKRTQYSRGKIKRIGKPITNAMHRGRGNFKSASKGDFPMLLKKAPFPPKMQCCLQYSDNFVLTVGSSGVYGTEQVYRLNSLYDTDFTNAGHQPYGFDQVALLYRNYLVSAVKFELILSDPSQDGLNVAAILQPSSATYSLTGKSNNDEMERPMAVSRVLNNTGDQMTRIRQFIKLRKLEGLTKAQWECGIAQYGSVMGDNPDLTPYLRVAICDTRNGSSGTIVLRSKITYYCNFWNRIDLTQS